MENLTYRTDDLTRWGTGQGSDLDAPQIDRNFFSVFSAIEALEDHQQFVAQIASMHAVGNQLFVTLTDNTVIGPITLPTSNWHFRADGWLPLTVYSAFDVFNFNGATYLVNITHTSAATFSPNATDGATHNLYSTLLENPANMLPTNGTIGQRLVHQSGSPLATAWKSDRVRMAAFVPGVPSAGQIVIRYLVADHMTIPAGLAASIANSAFPPIASASWPMTVNGNSIGSITFSASPELITNDVSADIHLVPGDIFELTAPLTPDAQQADTSFTIIALLTE